MADISGTNLGPYELRSKLGQGGMGTVYRGYQASMGRDVAIKVLPAVLAQDHEFIARFRREATVIASLGHARILPVHDYGEQDGLAYLVMRYLDGSTLHERIEENGPLAPRDAARIIRQVCEGLNYAHKQGIIHRDMTANNIMFDSVGDAYITDFGLAKMMEGAAQLTGSGILGTPAYMSPEQGLGDVVDHRSDIYALGVVLFEMMTGDVPYHGSSAMVVVVKHINEPLPDPLALNPDIPEAVAQVIFRATNKEPNGRYQSCIEMADALDAAVRGAAGTSMPGAHTRPPQGTVKLPPEKPAPEPEVLPGWVIPAGILGGILVLALAYLLVIGPRLAGRTPTTPATPTLITTRAAATTAAAQPTTAPTDAPVSTAVPSPEAPQPSAPPPGGDNPTQAGGPNPGGQGGQPLQPLAPDPGLVTCPDGRSVILAHDFKDTRPEGLNLFAIQSDFLLLYGDALLIKPMPDGISIPLLLGPPITNTYILMRAGWADGPGSLGIEFAFDPKNNSSYNAVVDGKVNGALIEKDRTPLGHGPISAGLFDGKIHYVVLAVLDRTISIQIDGKDALTVQVPEPPPAGLIHLHAGGSRAGIDLLGVCGTR